jgi:hypothetical protein
MVIRQILFFVVLLGAWVQSASACPEAHVAPAPAQKVMEFTVSAVFENFAAIGGEHRCECRATIQNAQSVVSESGKSLLASYARGSGAFPNPSILNSIALAERNRASSSIARPSGRPPYLLVSRLRQ